MFEDPSFPQSFDFNTNKTSCLTYIWGGISCYTPRDGLMMIEWLYTVHTKQPKPVEDNFTDNFI